MKLKIKKLHFLTGRPVCMIHEDKAVEMSLHVSDRVAIKNKKGKKIVSIVDTVTGIIKKNEIAMSYEIIDSLNLKDKEIVDVELAQRPRSIDLIKKKLKGHILNKQEINEIVENIANNALTEVEVAFFIAAVYTKGMNMEETKNLTAAMVESGNRMKIKGIVADKHSIGGIAGNRTTPIVVSICVAEGLVMPKTSSRAITSAAGTADSIETIAKVDFSIKEIESIIRKTGGCFVWGGALGLAPVDDKIIKIERIVNIDSTAQLLASILSKKISVGSKYILIDIPYGRSAKVSKKQAQKLKNKFLELGSKFDLKLKVALTLGDEPIGNGIGPVLEIEDVIRVLKRDNPPKDLEQKCVFLAAQLLELTGKAKKGHGEQLAQESLDSGRAFKKFLEIIKSQNGSLKNFKKPNFSYEIKSEKNKTIRHLDNKLLNQLARFAGCPEDKEAGIYLNKKKGDIVKKGDTIMTLYTLSQEKMNQAKNFYNKIKNKLVIY